MSTNLVSLSGLTKALLSGYRYLYIPLEESSNYDNYYHNIYSRARVIGVKVDIIKQSLIDTETNTLSQIILIKVLGIDPEAEIIRKKKQEERDNKILKLAKKIKKMNGEGLNYREIAKQLGYKSTATITSILKEEVKIRNKNGLK